MFGASRRHSGPDPHLLWKVRLFSFGAALAIAGMFYESKWLMGAAFLVLSGGLLLRFLPESEEEAEGVPEGGE